MVTTTVTTPYATAMPFVSGTLDTRFGGEYDGQRLASYDLYDDLYSNSPASFSLMLRGADDKPIFIPTAKRIVNTLARYVGKGWGYAARPAAPADAEAEPDGADPTTAADPVAYQEALDAIDKLFRRERVLSQFSSGKKGFLRRGDWLWMISADPEKDAERRISLRTIDPRMYFVIQDDPNDPLRITGQQLIEETMAGETAAFRVQEWLKPSALDYAGDGESIWYTNTVYDQKDYGDPEKRKTLVQDNAEVIDGITNLPIYHIRNNEDPENPYGTSDLSGMESIIAGINQASTDEDMALALAGLGIFFTDGGAPVDEDGNEVDWNLGPGKVIEGRKGDVFQRIQGITSVDPYQKHIEYLKGEAFGTMGISDVAMGTATTSEAGVALALRLSPLFDAADEKNLAINDVWNNILHDLTQWYDVYEGIDLSVAEFTSRTQETDRLPWDRDARFTELMTLLTNKIVTVQWVHDELVDKFGYEIPITMLKDLADAASSAAAAADPYADRAGAELRGDAGDEETPADDAPAS